MRSILLYILGAGLLAAAPARPKLTVDRWSLSADVECGNSRIIERVGQDHFAVAPREDPLPIEVQKTGPISNYIVYLEIANLESKAREITLDVLIPEWLIRDKFDYFLRKTYVLRSPDNMEYYDLAAERHTSLPDKMRLRIPFAPGERKIVSTTPLYPYSVVRKRLESIERRSNGKAKVREIGRSIEGRPILSVETGDKSKPRAVFTATFQPGEPSAWAILAMIEAVLFDGELRQFQEKYDLAFVPMTNPDGVVYGSDNVNSKGDIVMLGFSAEERSKGENNEAKILWDYLKAKPPVVMVDFHFMVLPNHPIPRPYVFVPTLYKDPARRAEAISFIRRLERLSGAGPGKPIEENHPMWKHLATYNSVTNWNTIATLYQNTGPKSSYIQAQRRGVEVMRVALDPEYMK